jgi:hypothetical protein
MALARIGGPGIWFPDLPPNGRGTAPSVSAPTGLTASNHQYAFMGRVMWPDSAAGPKNLQQVEFLSGSTWVTGTATVRCSIQGVDQLNGTPARPDGVIKTGIAAGSPSCSFSLSTLAASTWEKNATIPALTDKYSVAYGELIAVVFDFTAYTSGTFGIGALSVASAQHFPTLSRYDGSTWSGQSFVPNVVLNFDDATVGTIEGGFVVKTAPNSASITSSSTPNEIGMPWTPPFKGTINAIGMFAGSSSTSNILSAALVDSSGSVIGSASASTDGHNFINATTSVRWLEVSFPETDVSAGTLYYIRAKGTSTGAFQMQTLTVNEAGHLDLHAGGQACSYVTRAGGAWTSTGTSTTQRPFIYVRYVKLDDGAGVAGVTSNINALNRGLA